MLTAYSLLSGPITEQTGTTILPTAIPESVLSPACWRIVRPWVWLIARDPTACLRKHSSAMVEENAFWLGTEWQKSPLASSVSPGPNSHMWDVSHTHVHTHGTVTICDRGSLTRAESDKKTYLFAVTLWAVTDAVYNVLLRLLNIIVFLARRHSTVAALCILWMLVKVVNALRWDNCRMGSVPCYNNPTGNVNSTVVLANGWKFWGSFN